MKLAIGSFVCAIIVVLWGHLSWNVLGWHNSGMRSFEKESVVAEVIDTNATARHGIYILPRKEAPHANENVDDREARVKKYEKAMEEGPYVYAIVRKGKMHDKFAPNLVLEFLRAMIASLIIGVLLSMMHLPYAGRLGVAAVAGLFAGLVSDMPMWIMFELPGRDLMINLTDHVIEWFLGGLALGAFVGKDPTAAHGHF